MDFDGLREAKARENTSARDSQGNLKCVYIRRVCDDWQYIGQSRSEISFPVVSRSYCRPYACTAVLARSPGTGDALGLDADVSW
jgi:hypothetical protein